MRRGSFPFEDLSHIAGLESWRKEINRPIYHIHKWRAQRLGHPSSIPQQRILQHHDRFAAFIFVHRMNRIVRA